jgi:1-acyl-sn-glycerol-3-phosphate acyltransferase
MALAAAVAGLGVVGSLLGLAAVPLDRRARILRTSVFLVAYALLEVIVPLLLLGTWLLRVARLTDGAADLKAVGRSLDILLGVGRVVCGFRTDLEEPSALGPLAVDDPVLILARHGGIGDSFALVHLLITRFGRQPRVILKGVLTWDPMLDVALSRLGACWIGRSTEGNRARIARLAEDVRPGDAILLFPEGGNWTPGRRLSIMARHWKAGRSDALKVASLMTRVLPPKPGGVLACLGARPELPVVVMAHAGLDQITSFSRLWQTLPFSVPMRIRWWPAAPAPFGEDERERWLTAEWAIVEEWIEGSD